MYNFNVVCRCIFLDEYKEYVLTKIDWLEYNYYSISGPVDSSVFFNYYLAAPRPTLGHYRGGSFTHPMLITAFLHNQPKVTGSLVTRLCYSNALTH